MSSGGFEFLDDLSPLSDRVATASTTKQSSKRLVPPPATVREESPLVLPTTVTRRGFIPKRTITPRGKRANPFENAEVLVSSRHKGDTEEVAAPAVRSTPDVVATAESDAPSAGCPPTVGPSRDPGRPPCPAPSHAPKTGATRVEKSPEFSGTYREYSGLPTPQGVIPAPTASSAPRMDSLAALDLSPVPRVPHEPSPTGTMDFPLMETNHPRNSGARAAADEAMITSPGRRSVSLGSLEDVKHFMSVAAQMLGVVLVSVLLAVILIFFVAPLTVRYTSEEDALVKHHVHSVTQLQAIYDVPFFALNTSETRCLYLRVLEDGAEELQRIVSSLPDVTDPSDDRDVAYAKRLLRTQQILRAHHHMRHRARLYARSRDGSLANHLLFYPFRDAWVYGVVRHGVWDTLRGFLWAPSLDDWYARLVDVGSCMRQVEQLPCPSLGYLEEKAERRLQQARGERGSAQERAEEVARQIIDGSTHSNDFYNSHCASFVHKSGGRRDRHFGNSGALESQL